MVLVARFSNLGPIVYPHYPLEYFLERFGPVAQRTPRRTVVVCGTHGRPHTWHFGDYLSLLLCKTKDERALLQARTPQLKTVRG